MPHWKELQQRTDLSHAEIRQIPGAACENFIAALRYWVDRRGYTEEEVLDGMEISFEDFFNGKNWLSTIDTCTFNSNLFKHSKRVMSHHEAYYGGVNMQFLSNSLLVYFFKAISAGRILREIPKMVTRFNNTYQMRTAGYQNGNTYVLLEHYPFYNEWATGADCQFTEGVLAANFQVHKIRTYSTRHLICSALVENIVKHAYSHYGITLQVAGRDYFIDDLHIGRKVRLQSREIDGERIFIDEVDESAAGDWNAVQILQDFVHKGVTLFREGEIYNAPYCVMQLEWREPSLLKRLLNGFDTMKQFKQNLNNIEQQIEFTNIKLFEVQEALNESQRKSAIFEVYTRSTLVQAVDTGEDPLTYSPQEVEKTFLFTDIRNFTTLSETMTPIDLVRFLNSYYDRISDTFAAMGGEIDKLIGDCIMAVFDDADSAVTAAVAARRSLADYNRSRISYGLMKIATGIGIATGPVVAGNIGSKCKMDFTFIGDTVNVASRLEALTKYYNAGVIISEQTQAQLSRSFETRFLDSVLVKGKISPLKIYQVYDQLPAAVKQCMENIRPRMDTAYQAYFAGNFSDALQLYTQIADELGAHRWHPELCKDPSIHFYIKRCRELDAQKAMQLLDMDEWRGIYEFMDK